MLSRFVRSRVTRNQKEQFRKRGKKSKKRPNNKMLPNSSSLGPAFPETDAGMREKRDVILLLRP